MMCSRCLPILPDTGSVFFSRKSYSVDFGVANYPGVDDWRRKWMFFRLLRFDRAEKLLLQQA